MSFSQLLLLDIPCPEGLRQVTELKNRVAQLPYTLLAFAGVSGVTLKVVVRCQYSNDEKPWVLTDKTLDTDKYLAFLKTAHECAARIYTSLTMCDLIVDEQSLAHGCRMSHDPQRRYQLRYNVVKQLTEFRPNDLAFKPWQPLTDRLLKSMVVEQMKEGGESWMNDIRIYLESAHIKDYNPVHEFLAGCGEWDGKADYIEDFARRLPTNYQQWPKYFHRWFLAMVAQALDINRDYGNSMVPMLIGGQGIKKSNFCKNILPPSMREYYMDDIKMDNAEQVERVLGRMWLVCIDEYNAKTDREQAKIKRLLTEKDVQIRKMRSDQYTMTPRLCSFIATTNDLTPLPAGDGSRRYLCVEVTDEVDMSGRIPYKQMYAQAVYELQVRNALYWFTSDDEQEIQRHNRPYQQASSIEEVLTNLFVPATDHQRENLWQVQDIQKELSKHLKASDVPNIIKLGKILKALRWPRGGNTGTRGYYLQLKKS